MALALGTIVWADPTRQAMGNAVEALVNGGTDPVLELRDNATPGSGTLLASIPLNGTDAITSVSSTGLITFVVPATVNGVANGIPLSYQLKGNASAVIFQGTVTGGDTINTGQPVNLTTFTVQIPA